jgi:hypothetical protein
LNRQITRERERERERELYDIAAKCKEDKEEGNVEVAFYLGEERTSLCLKFSRLRTLVLRAGAL